MPGHDDRDDDPGGGVVVAIQRASVAEVRRQVTDLRGDIERVEERVDDNTDKIYTLGERQARTEGEVAHLVRAYERAATVATSQVMTDLEVKKADALERIKQDGLDRKHRRAVRRELIFKAVTVAMGIWALVQTILASRC